MEMKRILIALLLSISGIALSWFFLRPKEWTSNSRKDRQVIARILELRNDVNRQEEGRLLWSPIRKGDEIFLGDKIKTSSLSGAVVEFIESSSKLEIEENSMIVMSQGEKKLELNMLEGRVFIQQDGNSDEKLNLLSGGKKLDLKGNAAISVSKDGVGQVESFSQQSIFTDLKPNYSEEVLSTKNDLMLNWKSLNRAETVEVYVGESPLLLKKVEGVSSPFVDGKLSVPMKPGVNYWQLISKSGDTEIKSPLMKLNLVRPLSPTPVYPSDKEIIKAGDRPFDFKWMKGNAGDKVIVEVARDQGFSQILITKEVTDQTFFTPDALLTQGEYYWRVKSRLANSAWIESKANAFTVHVGSSLLSPSPLAPQDNTIYYVGKNPTNVVKFEWRKQDNVRGYELKIQGENFNRDTQLAENSAKVNLNRIGKYTWEVLSEGRDGKKSILPVKRKFEVRAVGSVQWNMAQKNFLYLESLPIVILRWEKNLPGVSLLKISSVPDFKESETFQVQGKDFPYRVLKDGIYFAKVALLDESGETAAESDILEFKVQEAPLPPAPLLISKARKLRASPEGNLRSQVENGKPSWLTIVSIVDGTGRVIDERRFSDDKLIFSGLMPGKYFLVARFQDEYRRQGEASERIEIEVPEKSMIAAPKLKGIKVR